jgi:hypothetical protein
MHAHQVILEILDFVGSLWAHRALEARLGVVDVRVMKELPKALHGKKQEITFAL